MTSGDNRHLLWPATLLVLGLCAGVCGQDRAEPLPAELSNVGIDEKIGARLPLDLELADHTGQKVRLGDYFDGQRPVILTLNYFKCPMLCGLTLNGMTDGLRDLDWLPGKEFRIVTVSFDPLERHQLQTVSLKRRNYLEYYGRPEAGDGWQFLVGSKKSIDVLLGATGFRVAWNEERKEWMHLAALIVCSPDGRISRYLYGVYFEPQSLKLALVEAGEGKTGSTLDRVLLFCYHYDGKGGYTLAAMRLVQAGGGLTLVIVALLLGAFWYREHRRRKAVVPAAAADDGSP